jgi:hypothetical protein
MDFRTWCIHLSRFVFFRLCMCWSRSSVRHVCIEVFPRGIVLYLEYERQMLGLLISRSSIEMGSLWMSG